MPGIRTTILGVLTAILSFGTLYSVTSNSYLDTSNALLTNLPHPLHESQYFASKTNILNTLFIKRAWGWTSLAFLLSFVTSPPRAQTRQRLYKYFTETAIWVVFTAWFFGPAIIERVIAASGGECILPLPGGEIVAVPAQYCYTKSTISPNSHPQLFATQLFLPATDWQAMPRMRRGHDISGHIFLLTMAVLFLADQLRYSLKDNAALWPPFHKLAVAFNSGIIALWLFASWTTSVYFHTPFEKFTGFLLGVASFSITLLPVFEEENAVTSPSIQKPRAD